jgi:hypothetical protein
LPPPPQPPAAFNKQLGDNSLFQWRKVPKRYHPITPISNNIKIIRIIWYYDYFKYIMHKYA